MSFIFWLILVYLLYKFIFGFVIPVISASRNVRAKMKEFQQQQAMGGEYRTDNNTNQSHTGPASGKSNSSASSAAGDYIDFEEIK